LYDKHLGLAVAFEAEEEREEVRARYTVADVVRVVTTDGHDIRPAEMFRPSLRVLSFDIENAIRERTIFTICGVAEGGGRPRTTFRLQGPERHILEGFVGQILQEDPDVITGYNIGGYDFPLLVERAKATGSPSRKRCSSSRAPSSATPSSTSTGERSRGSGPPTRFGLWSTASTTRTSHCGFSSVCARSRRRPTSRPSPIFRSRKA